MRAPREVDAVQVEPGGGLEKRNHNHVTKWKSRLDKFSVVFGNLHTAAAHKHGNTFRAQCCRVGLSGGLAQYQGSWDDDNTWGKHTKWQCQAAYGDVVPGLEVFNDAANRDDR